MKADGKTQTYAFTEAVMRYTLSPQRREFLQAGDVFNFWIARGTWLTAGYQRIQNPAYNADRGPVNVYALRFHAEF